MIETELILLCLAAFMAGFIDSIVGGGGLIQLPALMMLLPAQPLITLLATNKLVSMTGTAVSAWRFSRHVNFKKEILLPAIVMAFIGSFMGAYAVSLMSSEILKPFFILLLFAAFVVTLKNKNFGLFHHDPNIKITFYKPLLIGILIGFYDGFFGPGTGSFLIIAFVGVVGMTFVQGSAYAKIINLVTNLAAICLFLIRAEFLFSYAAAMIIFNVGGALLGVKLALLKGNEFVRVLLRGIILLTIIKLSIDIYHQFIQ